MSVGCFFLNFAAQFQGGAKATRSFISTCFFISLALTLIIAHLRLRDAPVPVNDDLSAFHRQLRRTADHVISAGSDDKRRRYFTQLLAELDVYQEKLRVWEASPQVTEPVRRLVEMLHKYQHVLTSS